MNKGTSTLSVTFYVIVRKLASKRIIVTSRWWTHERLSCFVILYTVLYGFMFLKIKIITERASKCWSWSCNSGFRLLKQREPARQDQELPGWDVGLGDWLWAFISCHFAGWIIEQSGIPQHEPSFPTHPFVSFTRGPRVGGNNKFPIWPLFPPESRTPHYWHLSWAYHKQWG